MPGQRPGRNASRPARFRDSNDDGAANESEESSTNRHQKPATAVKAEKSGSRLDVSELGQCTPVKQGRVSQKPARFRNDDTTTDAMVDRPKNARRKSERDSEQNEQSETSTSGPKPKIAATPKTPVEHKAHRSKTPKRAVSVSEEMTPRKVSTAARIRDEDSEEPRSRSTRRKSERASEQKEQNVASSSSSKPKIVATPKTPVQHKAHRSKTPKRAGSVSEEMTPRKVATAARIRDEDSEEPRSRSARRKSVSTLDKQEQGASTSSVKPKTLTAPKTPEKSNARSKRAASISENIVWTPRKVLKPARFRDDYPEEQKFACRKSERDSEQKKQNVASSSTSKPKNAVTPKTPVKNKAHRSKTPKRSVPDSEETTPRKVSTPARIRDEDSEEPRSARRKSVSTLDEQEQGASTSSLKPKAFTAPKTPEKSNARTKRAASISENIVWTPRKIQKPVRFRDDYSEEPRSARRKSVSGWDQLDQNMTSTSKPKPQTFAIPKTQEKAPRAKRTASVSDFSSPPAKRTSSVSEDVVSTSRKAQECATDQQKHKVASTPKPKPKKTATPKTPEKSNARAKRAASVSENIAWTPRRVQKPARFRDDYTEQPKNSRRKSVSCLDEQQQRVANTSLSKPADFSTSKTLEKSKAQAKRSVSTSEDVVMTPNNVQQPSREEMHLKSTFVPENSPDREDENAAGTSKAKPAYSTAIPLSEKPKTVKMKKVPSKPRHTEAADSDSDSEDVVRTPVAPKPRATRLPSTGGTSENPYAKIYSNTSVKTTTPQSSSPMDDRAESSSSDLEQKLQIHRRVQKHINRYSRIVEEAYSSDSDGSSIEVLYESEERTTPHSAFKHSYEEYRKRNPIQMTPKTMTTNRPSEATFFQNDSKDHPDAFGDDSNFGTNEGEQRDGYYKKSRVLSTGHVFLTIQNKKTVSIMDNVLDFIVNSEHVDERSLGNDSKPLYPPLVTSDTAYAFFVKGSSVPPMEATRDDFSPWSSNGTQENPTNYRTRVRKMGLSFRNGRFMLVDRVDYKKCQYHLAFLYAINPRDPRLAKKIFYVMDTNSRKIINYALIIYDYRSSGPIPTLTMMERLKRQSDTTPRIPSPHNIVRDDTDDDDEPSTSTKRSTPDGDFQIPIHFL